MSLPVDPHLFSIFLGVMAVMALTPGPANVFAIASGAHRGPRGALLTVAGMNSATLVWFGAAALGLAALVKAYPEVFRMLTYAGAAYVAWLGAKSLWNGVSGAAAAPVASRAIGASAFGDGFAVQISNPKAILFFTAVLPPFLDPVRPAATQLAMFACATIGMDVIAMSAYGLTGSALSRAFEQRAFRRAFACAVGVLLLLASALILLRH